MTKTATAAALLLALSMSGGALAAVTSDPLAIPGPPAPPEPPTPAVTATPVVTPPPASPLAGPSVAEPATPVPTPSSPAAVATPSALPPAAPQAAAPVAPSTASTGTTVAVPPEPSAVVAPAPNPAPAPAPAAAAPSRAPFVVSLVDVPDEANLRPSHLPPVLRPLASDGVDPVVLAATASDLASVASGMLTVLAASSLPGPGGDPCVDGPGGLLVCADVDASRVGDASHVRIFDVSMVPRGSPRDAVAPRPILDWHGRIPRGTTAFALLGIDGRREFLAITPAEEAPASPTEASTP